MIFHGFLKSFHNQNKACLKKKTFPAFLWLTSGTDWMRGKSKARICNLRASKAGTRSRFERRHQIPIHFNATSIKMGAPANRLASCLMGKIPYRLRLTVWEFSKTYSQYDAHGTQCGGCISTTEFLPSTLGKLDGSYVPTRTHPPVPGPNLGWRSRSGFVWRSDGQIFVGHTVLEECWDNRCLVFP